MDISELIFNIRPHPDAEKMRVGYHQGTHFEKIDNAYTRANIDLENLRRDYTLVPWFRDRNGGPVYARRPKK